MKNKLTEHEYNKLKEKFDSEDELNNLIQDLNIEIYVLDDVTIVVKRKDRVERQWLFTQLDTLLQMYNHHWNHQIVQTIRKERVLSFQPICEIKTTKKTHITVLGEIFKTNPVSIFQKHKFMKKFLRRASREFDIPFGYSLRNPVDEPDQAHGVKTAVKRLGG